MRYCSRCGVPRTLTSEHRWGSGGTIALVNDPTHRMVFLDNLGLSNILDSIAESIKLPIDNIIAGAKRKSGKHFMDALLKGPKGVVARNLVSFKVYQQIAKQIPTLGLGKAQVIGYRRHQFLEGRVQDAYSGPAIAGDICGAFESVEKCAADVQYEFDDNGVLGLVIRRSEAERPEYAGRFHYQPPPVVPGKNIFELCPVCKAPLELGLRYNFDMDRGIIKEQKTGHRVILIGVGTINNLFGELASELGEEIPNMIMNIEKERVKNIITGKGKDLDTSEEGYIRYMKTLGLKGMGDGGPVSVDGGRVKARVNNPYFEPLIAGFLAGFYESTTGKSAGVEWTPAAEGYTEVTLEPA